MQKIFFKGTIQKQKKKTEREKKRKREIVSIEDLSHRHQSGVIFD